MTPAEPPGVPLSVALMATGAVVCLMVLILIVASVASTHFQRMQDKRWERRDVTRFEWLRMSAGMWVRAVLDSIRRRTS